jgi:hypothetical protein
MSGFVVILTIRESNQHISRFDLAMIKAVALIIRSRGFPSLVRPKGHGYGSRISCFLCFAQWRSLMSFGSRQGFVMDSENGSVSFVCRNGPHMIDISTHWFALRWRQQRPIAYMSKMIRIQVQNSQCRSRHNRIGFGNGKAIHSFVALFAVFVSEDVILTWPILIVAGSVPYFACISRNCLKFKFRLSAHIADCSNGGTSHILRYQASYLVQQNLACESGKRLGYDWTVLTENDIVEMLDFNADKWRSRKLMHKNAFGNGAIEITRIYCSQTASLLVWTGSCIMGSYDSEPSYWSMDKTHETFDRAIDTSNRPWSNPQIETKRNAVPTTHMGSKNQYASQL